MTDAPPFSFEKMKPNDIPAVMAVERRAFTLHWSEHTYRHELLENKHAHYYVLRHRSSTTPSRWSRLLRWLRRDPEPPVIGYGGFWMITDEAHISTIAVEMGWRGHGLGEYLLASMIAQAMDMRAVQVTLEVRETNRVAQNLYRKYGFEITGKRLNYYQDNHENAFLMIVSGVHTPEYQEKFRRLASMLPARLARLQSLNLPAVSTG